MALKGTTVIELTNVKTGETERYEEHNLITQALAEIHKPIGNLKRPTDLTTDGYEPAYLSVLGGIVLWDSTISENDSIITKPHGVNMVGCASCEEVNGTTSSRRGSYNETESYLTTSSTERSMKFVYDFATNQANGTIKSISLTNWKTGWNGFGGNEGGVDWRVSRNQYGTNMGHNMDTSYWFNASVGTPGKVVLIDAEEDCFYQISSLTTSTLKIAKRRANIYQRSVFQSAFHVHDLIETISVTLPTTLSGVNTYFGNYDPKTNLLYVVVSPSASSVASKGAFYVIAVDMETRAATVHTMTNPLGSTMYASDEYIVCYDGYLYYAYQGVKYIRKIALADSTYSSIYTSWTIWSSNSFCFLMNEMIYFYVYKSINSNNYGAVAMLDPDAGTVEITGDTYYPDRWTTYRVRPIPIKGHPLHFYYFYTYDTNSTGVATTRAIVWLDTRYLATINNLSREIEKTSDKTMKITYTIQEV